MEIADEIKRHIIVALIKNPDLLVLEDNYPLIERGVIDSLGMLSLLEFVERKFSVQIGDAEITPENFETPLAISKLIECKLNALQEA